jgi:hypothetical protein
MDGNRFDQWTQRLAGGASRRGVLRGLSAAAVAVALGGRGAEAALGGRGAEAAATCIKNGKECNPKNRGRCCSGNCRKSGRGHTCKPAPNALGCTVNLDSCVAGEDPIPCPGNPDGICVVLDNGRPFCSGLSRCTACNTGADCDAAFGKQGGICVKSCPDCAGQGDSACVFPFESL